MYYWHLTIDYGKGIVNDVFLKTEMDYSKRNIPNVAVESGDLLDVNVAYVSVIDRITAENYYEFMAD